MQCLGGTLPYLRAKPLRQEGTSIALEASRSLFMGRNLVGTITAVGGGTLRDALVLNKQVCFLKYKNYVDTRRYCHVNLRARLHL